ncbi:MAG: hypothetical protein R2839_10520 [Thermomicrobiales bacterium]
MNVPLKWLNDFVDAGVPVRELAHRLTMAGLEVEKIEAIGSDWEHVYVGQVKDVSPHPDADRLVLADVEAGPHRLTVVTGAPNIAAGQTVALALAGANLIDGHSDSGQKRVLKPTKMWGILSEGMVCSEKELGLSDEHEGILVLDDSAPLGVLSQTTWAIPLSNLRSPRIWRMTSPFTAWPGKSLHSSMCHSPFRWALI